MTQLQTPTIQEIFRIENPETMNGMWYNQYGKLDPFIKTLTEGISADLPMEPHERYGQGGKRWFSGCKDFELMRHWFSTRDILELHESGYKLYKFESQEFQNEELQTIFTREGITSQTEININELIK